MILSQQRTISWQVFRLSVRTVVFFVLFFLFVLLWIDARLVYYSHGLIPIICFLDSSKVPWVFADCPFRPGEMVDYLATCLSHYYYYGWSAAIIVTGLACILTVTFRCMIRIMVGRRFVILSFVPALIMILQYGRYYYYTHYMADGLAMTIAMLFFCLYMLSFPSNSFLRVIVFIVFLTVVFVLASPAYMLFVLLCIIFEFIIRRSRIAGICCVILAGVAPCLLSILYPYLTLREVYSCVCLTGRYSKVDTIGVVLAVCPFVYLFVVGLVCAFCRSFTGKKKPLANKAVRGGNFRWFLETLILLVLLSATVFFGIDRIRRGDLRINYFARFKMWPKLLCQAREMRAFDRPCNIFTCFEVNRALYHTGQLADEMFSYPQHPLGLLLTAGRMHEGWNLLQTTIKLSDVLYELGDINKSENYAYEALGMTDYGPWLLQRLAMINIVKFQPDAARTFLRRLRGYLPYRSWADDCLQRLDVDPFFLNDADIKRLRDCMVKTNTLSDAAILLPLLRSNPHNRMAFEYMMCSCLHTVNLEVFTAVFPQINDFDYPDIPRHYQEAILVYQATGHKVDLAGRSIDPQIRNRFSRFLADWKVSKGAAGTNMERLKKEYGDTFYYYMFTMPRNRTSSAQPGNQK